jgi:hypothetical protein
MREQKPCKLTWDIQKPNTERTLKIFDARAKAGMVPKSIDEEFSVIDHGARGEEAGWDVAPSMSTNGFL